MATTISEQIARIESNRNTIRNKFVELGISQSADTLDDLATAAEGIIDRGAVSATVQEGDTYTIPKGYHNGSGTVSGVAGGGNYNLQSKNVTPTKAQQNVTPDSGYYGLSDVTVGAIPVQYQDVTSVTAKAEEVLTGKVYVDSTGKVTAGTMPNNGKVDKTLDTTIKSYTIPKGYHSGTGTVNIVTEDKSATPTKSPQTINPEAGKVLGSVTVNAIPEEYITTTDADAESGDIISGKSAYVNGSKIEGTMPDNGSVSKTLDTATTSFLIPEGRHDGTGTVNIVTETKTATPTKKAQNITPTTGKVLSGVAVNPIPEAYQDVTEVTASATDVLTGKVIVSSTGEKVTGSIPNNGATNLTIDGITALSVAVPAGYTSGGTVSLTDDILNALMAI